MRLDEMVIKANVDGKTYFCNGTELEYSRENGFTKTDGTSLLQSISLDVCPSVCVTGWKEKPKRHLTVSEAEKELDCVIDTPDISKLFRSMSEHPNNGRNVIIVYSDRDINTNSYGFYGTGDNCWRWSFGNNNRICYNGSVYWIDMADLIKPLPKE